MWSRFAVVVALVVQLSFPARNPQTLRQRYGEPISETFQIRPDVLASAQYGKGGDVCYIIITAKAPPSFGPTTVDSQLMKDVVDELAPVHERGTFRRGGLGDGFCGTGTYNFCGGSEEDWTEVAIFRNSYYATVQWHRDECPPEKP